MIDKASIISELEDPFRNDTKQKTKKDFADTWIDAITKMGTEKHINPGTDTAIKCCHYDVCYMIHAHNKCINDKPTEIPCIFDSRKEINFSRCASHAPVHPPGAQQRINAEQEVIKAAMNWWMMQRPLDWSEEQHLKHPTINIFGNQERALAEAIALLQAGDPK